MNLYLKLVFVCIIGGLLSLTVKKHSPEIALLIGISAALTAVTSVMDIMDQLKAYIQSLPLFLYFDSDSFAPLVKCILVSVIAQTSCAICKDAGQTAVAYALEFTGSIVIILCLMPLIDLLFQLLGGMI